MKIPPQVEAALNTTGLPWVLEQGGRHQKIKLGGRLVGILPNGKVNTSHKRTLLNTIAQIRRVAQEIATQ